MFTNKDTTFLVLENLDDESLLNMCLVNKFIHKLCDDDNFWHKRFLTNFGDYEKSEDKTWKRTYLEVVYYTNLAEVENNLNNSMGLAALDGNFDMVKYFISRGADNWKMGRVAAEKGGYDNLVQFFKEKEPLTYLIYNRPNYRPNYHGFDFYIADEYSLYGPREKFDPVQHLIDKGDID